MLELVTYRRPEVLGIVTSYQNFPQGYSTLLSNGASNIPEALAYDSIGLACAVLSLATNVIATALIGHKAWYVIIPGYCREYLNILCIRTNRRIVKKYQIGGETTQARAVSVLMFIVESGVGYCLLWVRLFISVSSPN